MKAEIVHKTDDKLLIQWEDEKGFFGQLGITYDGEGDYTIDAEYIGIEKILEIIKCAK